MSVPPPSPRHTIQRLIVPAMLVLAAIAAALFLSMLINYIDSQPVRPTPTLQPSATHSRTPSPSPTITLSATPSRTPRPTWTLQPSKTIPPSSTATATRTPTRIPTLGAAVPLADNIRYRLSAWDASDTQRMIDLLQVKAELENTPEWYLGLANALREALLRHPSLLETVHWQWQLASALAHANDPLAAQQYADLIQSAVASGQVRVEDLPAWFLQHEAELALALHPLPTQPGELSRRLVEIHSQGSAYLVLVETPAGAQVFPLLTDFHFDTPIQTSFLLADLTNNGIQELALYQTSTSTELTLLPPHIFSLASLPPAELPIQQQTPFNFNMEAEVTYQALEQSGANTGLHMTAIFFPICPVQVTRTYQWHQTQFTATPLVFAIDPGTTVSGYCETVIDHAALAWGAETALTLAEPLLPVWPPEQDPNGKPYPADASDGWRYRLGMYQALAGHATQALSYMNAIVTSPTVADSTWIRPAEQFIAAYQSPEDLYRACQAAPTCNLHLAIQTLARSSGLDDPSDVLEYLRLAGMETRVSGYFDFDGDGLADRWMSVRPRPTDKLEFWVLLCAPQGGVQAFFIQIYEVNQPEPFYAAEPSQPPVVQLENGKGFIFQRLAGDEEISLTFVDVGYTLPGIIPDGITQNQQALLSGADPAQVIRSLLALQASPRFLGDCRALSICDEFYYTLGLAYELNGSDEMDTLGAYLYLWRDQPKSPYTQIVRLRLELRPIPPTSTRTPTPTRTETEPPDPNITPSVTPTPTETATPTDSAYP